MEELRAAIGLETKEGTQATRNDRCWRRSRSSPADNYSYHGAIGERFPRTPFARCWTRELWRTARMEVRDGRDIEAGQGQGEQGRRVRQEGGRKGDEGSEPPGEGPAQKAKGTVQDVAGKVERKVRGSGKSGGVTVVAGCASTEICSCRPDGDRSRINISRLQRSTHHGVSRPHDWGPAPRYWAAFRPADVGVPWQRGCRSAFPVGGLGVVRRASAALACSSWGSGSPFSPSAWRPDIVIRLHVNPPSFLRVQVSPTTHR